MTVGITVHVISSLVLPWIGSPSDSSPGLARYFHTQYPSITRTIENTKHDRMIITFRSVSMSCAWVDASVPFQWICVIGTAITTVRTAMAAMILASVARVTARHSIARVSAHSGRNLTWWQAALSAPEGPRALPPTR